MLSVVVGGFIGAGKNWLRPIAAGAAGYLADKHGVARVIAVCFTVLIVSFLILGLVPSNAALVPAILINITIGFLGIFALRGIYFALLEEVKIPMAVTGTAAGVLSIIGFTPDIFMPIIGGAFLDASPGEQGYQYFFLFIAMTSAIGLVATLAILKRAHKVGQSEEEA